KDNHLLNLKVMRLSKPHIPTNNAVLCERDDIMNDILLPSSVQLGNNDTNGGGIEALGISSMLLLQSGIIYLGEIFTSYITLNNHSTQDVNNVFIKVELQTTTQRIPLLDSEQNPIKKFGPGFNSDFVVQREVKESGPNILCCAVNYTTLEGEVRKFKKFFKFQVMNPLIIKTKIQNLPNLLFLEACLENATQGSLFIESIAFEPTELFTVTPINDNTVSGMTIPGSTSSNPTSPTVASAASNPIKSSLDPSMILAELRAASNVVFLKEGTSRHYLFKIAPKDPNDFDTKNSPSLGKLDITWRSYLGEIGRLKTAFIQRKVNLEDVECILTKIPKVELEKPFVVTSRIINKTNRILHPLFVLVRNKMEGILINGHLPRIGALQPNSSLDIDIEMFPLKPGMQQIAGLAIKLLETSQSDSSSSLNNLTSSSSSLASSVGGVGGVAAGAPPAAPKNYYELGVLADVFVENNNASSSTTQPFFQEVSKGNRNSIFP
ncbi:hypothetical protein SAMD00019534_012970, partial [Acytostelium subglobosum LB1]|uniref:hypothetical protein n=1 Tax=Acytostelium subglobosum LB1 TaxID=1410327 RepID=UPI0006449071